MIVLAAIVLAQTTVSESITVTATRTETRVADTPASVVVLSKETLDATAAPTTDDALRQVAGFTLFRRAGSRVANPTTQGVSLRGVGASGASRALVLDDGVPLNDPFGGWVYWGRVPRAALDRVEVLRGGASDLYGSSAMGGVVQFIRRKSAAVDIDASAGSQGTGTLSLFAGSEHLNVAADLLTTSGYTLVRPEERGLVDVDADSRHGAVDATARFGNVFARASWYRESRNNGTPLTENDTTIGQLAAGADIGNLLLRAYVSDQDYFQTFSAVEDDRESERLTVEQTVPSRGIGGSAQWTRVAGSRHVIVAGADLRAVRGSSDEVRFTATGTPFEFSAGGRQRMAAAYVEDLFTISPSVIITAGLRTDAWRNESDDDRHSTEVQLNPRVSVLWRGLSVSAYQAFRAPTLNELYRGFRVGNVNTLANAALHSENLTGFEAGARARNFRVTAFWTVLTGAIANITLFESGGVITRQRQNLGRTWSRGAELAADWRLGTTVRASVGWLSVDATVREGELRGKRLPQVPRNQLTAQLQWRTIGIQTRWSARQFDDDRNELPLGAYFVADAFASHPVARGVDVTFAIENLFEQDVEVSATPVVTLGQPRAWRIGFRYVR